MIIYPYIIYLINKGMIKILNLTLGVLILILTIIDKFKAQQFYNYASINSYTNNGWMATLDDKIPLRKISIPGTHSSMSQSTLDNTFQTQGLSLTKQLNSGIRALDIRCRHKNDKFLIYQRTADLNIDITGVLNLVNTFLNSYPTQTILMHIVEEHIPFGNTRFFEDTFAYYRSMFSGIIWIPTSQNPTLKETRGKVVIIQNFVGQIYGLLYSTFNVLPNKMYYTNWDQYDKWTDLKNFIRTANFTGQSQLSFWTGSGGSAPYFIASGKSAPGNNNPLLSTNLTTPSFDNYYSDFPRTNCTSSKCTISFQGINNLAYNYFFTNNYNYLGIVFIDFPGDILLQSIIKTNTNLFRTCIPLQASHGCVACSLTDACVVCNKVSYYVLNDVTGVCDAEKGYYLNNSYIPQLCSDIISGCLQCNSNSNCTKCDTYLHYILKNEACIAQPGYYLDGNSIPQKCKQVGCSQCSSASKCTLCSSNDNFISDGYNGCQCDTANFFIRLSNNASCICSPGKYFDTATPVPAPAPAPAPPLGPSTRLLQSNFWNLSVSSTPLMGTCTTCNNFTSLTPTCSCNVASYYNGTDCVRCNQKLSNACIKCISDSLCISCINNFTLKGGKCVCQPLFYLYDTNTCLQYPTGCIQYAPQVGCTRCDISIPGNILKNAAREGESAITSKTTGSNLSRAYQPVRRLLQGTTVSSTCNLCQLIIGCLACTINGCIQCNSTLGFVLSNNNCKCNIDRFLDSMLVCQKCSQDGCLTCISQTICTSCTPIYYLSNVVCVQNCGDGIRLTLECDDGNLQNGDGCSSTCTIQPNFNCIGGSKTSKSACSYSGTLQLRVVKFQKQPLKNQFVAQFQISPTLTFLNNLNFTEAIHTNFPYQNMTITYSNITGMVQIRFQYNQSLSSFQGLQINFNFPQTPEFLFTPSASYMLPSTTDNNLSLQYYDTSIYQSMPTIQTLVMVLTILSLGLFFFLFIVVSKLMAVEFIAVFQLAYIGLMMISRLEPLLTPLSGLWIVNGYNGIIMGYPNADLPSRISGIGYKSFFLENFNLMVLMLLLPLLVGTVLLIYSKVLLRKKTQEEQIHFVNSPLMEAELLSEHSQRYRNNLVQPQMRQLQEIHQEIQPIQGAQGVQGVQGVQEMQRLQQPQNPNTKLKITDQLFISQKHGDKTLLYATEQQPYKKHRRWAYLWYKEYELSSFLFISYQLLVSLGIAFVFGLDQIFGIILGIIVMLGLVAMTILFYLRPVNFGQYKTFFTEAPLSKNFYIVIIILRICIGLSISLPTNPTISVCLTLSFCIIYFLLLALIRPYQSNLRPIVNSIFTVIIFIIYTIYGLNLLQSSQLKTTYLPIIVMCVLFICLVFNLCYIGWYIYQICKDKKSEEQLSREIDQTRVILNQLRGDTLYQSCNNKFSMIPVVGQSIRPCIQIMKQINKPQDDLIDLSIQQVNALFDAI